MKSMNISAILRRLKMRSSAFPKRRKWAWNKYRQLPVTSTWRRSASGAPGAMEPPFCALGEERISRNYCIRLFDKIATWRFSWRLFFYHCWTFKLSSVLSVFNSRHLAMLVFPGNWDPHIFVLIQGLISVSLRIVIVIIVAILVPNFIEVHVSV